MADKRMMTSAYWHKPTSSFSYLPFHGPPITHFNNQIISSSKSSKPSSASSPK